MAPPTKHLEALSDRELVLAFQSAHEDAYEEIFRRHSERVRRVCMKFLRDPHDAEEATQETFLRCYKALGRFNGRYQLGAWLARIATNVCLDEIRKNKSHVQEAPVEEADDFEATTSPPSDLVVQRTEVARSMGEIAPLHARALMLQAVEGLSHKEMAGELEMTAPQVKSLLHRARRSFRAAWQEASGWLIAPLGGFRSFASRDETRPAAEVTAGSTAHLSFAFVERLATGTVAAVIAISGLTSGTSVEVRERPRHEAESKEDRATGSIKTSLKVASATTEGGTSASSEAPLASAAALGADPSAISNSLDLGVVSGDATGPGNGGGGGDGDDRLIDTPPTTTGQKPVDQAVAKGVDLGNDTIEAGSGT